MDKIGNTAIMKGINQLEVIGKKGKLSKIVKLSIEHFEFLKHSLDEFSLKIIAYIIKGFFLTLKKSYENYNKDLETFIEINIKGVRPNKPKKKEKDKDKEKDCSEDIFTMNNLSLYSENTQFEKFLSDTNMSQRINKTLKEINKKFAQVDFASMSEEKKREYLKKNFVQPLSESLPMSCEYFANSSLEQCIAVNEDFANYIQFDMKTIADGKKKVSNNFENLFQIDNEVPDANVNQGGFNFENIVLNSKSLVRNPHLKSDMKIEINIDRFMNNSQDVRIKSDDFADSMNAYRRNYRKLVTAHHLELFKKKLIPNQTDFPQLINLMTTKYEDLVSMEQQESLPENFRGGIESTPVATERSFKVMSELQTTTSMKNVFDNPVDFFFQTPYANKSENNCDFDNTASNEGIMNVDFEDNLRLETSINREGRKLQEEENTRMINAEIQKLIENNFTAKKNFENFSLDKLGKEIALEIPMPTHRVKCSLVFYNMMIATQTGQFCLKQNQPFDKLYLVKI